MGMETNVSTLLREFPKVRRAAMAGETVIIKTREGNLRLVADRPSTGSIVGCMKNAVVHSSDDIDRPTSPIDEWDSDL